MTRARGRPGADAERDIWREERVVAAGEVGRANFHRAKHVDRVLLHAQLVGRRLEHPFAERVVREEELGVGGARRNGCGKVLLHVRSRRKVPPARVGELALFVPFIDEALPARRGRRQTRTVAPHDETGQVARRVVLRRQIAFARRARRDGAVARGLRTWLGPSP